MVPSADAVHFLDVADRHPLALGDGEQEEDFAAERARPRRPFLGRILRAEFLDVDLVGDDSGELLLVLVDIAGGELLELGGCLAGGGHDKRLGNGPAEPRQQHDGPLSADSRALITRDVPSGQPAP